MASSGAIRAGKAYVEVGADNSPLRADLKGALGMLKGFASAAMLGGAIGAGAALGSAAVGLLTEGLSAAAGLVPGMVSHFTEAGSALNDMSARTGASVESLSALGYAAKMAGASGEDVEKGLRKMQQTLVDAAGGSKTASDALFALGTSAQELKGLSPDEQFAKLADGISKISDPAERTAAAMDVFGKGGANLLPILADGAAGLEQWRKRAEEVGAVMSGEDAEAADALGDALDDLNTTWQGLGNLIGAELAPIITQVVDVMRQGVNVVRLWVAEHRGALETVGQVVSGIRDALSKGDFKGAFEVAWLGVKTVLLEAADWFWSSWGQKIIDGSISVWTAFRKAAGEAIGWVRKLLIDVGNDIDKWAHAHNPRFDEEWRKKQLEMDDDNAAMAKRNVDTQTRQQQEAIDKQRPTVEGLMGAAGQALGQNIRNELDAARQGLDAALARAKEGANALPEIVAKPQMELEKTLDTARATVSGTFSSQALSQIGGQSAHMKQTADNTKKTAEFSQRAVDALEAMNSRIGTLVFQE
jgi:hypothetical protein